MEERFCNMVKAMGCTCVTISHRPALVAFHDLVLALDGEGGWSLHRGLRSTSQGSDDNGFEALPAGAPPPAPASPLCDQADRSFTWPRSCMPACQHHMLGCVCLRGRGCVGCSQV